jgi:H+-transporting ATPase
MGSTISRGEVEGTVEFTGKDTFFGKTATLLQGDTGLGNLQRLLLKIMFVLIVVSLTLCITALIYLVVARNENFTHALSFTIVLLVASIPIAIEIVCTTTLALGSRQLSSYGAIVTRLQAIEEMAGMNMLCSDKTGTLTLNKMEIQDHCPTFSPQYASDMAGVVTYAALAAKWKEPAKDALDTMVLGAADLAALDAYTMVDHSPFDPTIKRTESVITAPGGDTFKVTKGAPHIVAHLVKDDAVQQRVDAEVAVLAARGIRSLAVARTTDAAQTQWAMLGILTFLDPPRPDTKRTVEQALEKGVDVKMVTGDQVLIAKEMSRILGLGTNVADAAGLPSMDADGKIPADLGKKYGRMILEADGFAQVYPEHKYLIVEALRQQGFAVGMTGDGVNDAPALKRADVGIAVSGATDAARAAADIVLTEPGLGVVIHAIVVARCIFQRVKNFINYRIAATLQLLLFFFIAVFAFPPQDYYCKADNTAVIDGSNPSATYGSLRDEVCDAGGACEANIECPTFFQLPVLMLMLITLLNDGTLISIGYDHVIPSPRPEKWNLRVLFLISSVLGLVSMASSLLLLWAALDSPNEGSLFQKLNLPIPAYGQITTMIYLKVSLSDFLTLFSARANPGPFWSQRPGKLLMAAASVALALSTALACLWPAGELDKVAVEGLTVGEYKLWPLWVWLFCIFFWWVQDAAKVLTYFIVYKYDIFQARTAALVNVREALLATDSEAATNATGMVERKLLGRKVDSAQAAVAHITRTSLGGVAPPALARVSATLALARTSVGPGGTAPARGVVSEQAIADLSAAAAEVGALVPPAQQEELRAQVAGVQQAAANLTRVSAALPKGKK